MGGTLQKMISTIDARGGLRALSVAACCALTGACATLPDDPAERADVIALNDPFEPANRLAYSFNSEVARTILAPVAMAAQVPVLTPVRTVVSNFLQNLREPMTFVNDIAQGHECAAGSTLRRFMVNSTLGIGGIFDVAKTRGKLEAHDNDFGTTLGVWGLPAGPYLVLPVLGPTDARGVVGTAVEYYADPVDLVWTKNGGSDWVVYTRTVLDELDQQAKVLPALAVIEKTSLDPYAAVRSAYRENLADQMKGPGCVEYAEW